MLRRTEKHLSASRRFLSLNSTFFLKFDYVTLGTTSAIFRREDSQQPETRGDAGRYRSRKIAKQSAFLPAIEMC